MAAFDTNRMIAASDRSGLFGRFFDAIAAWNELRVTRNALAKLSDRELAAADKRFPVNPPQTKEAYFCRAGASRAALCVSGRSAPEAGRGARKAPLSRAPLD
jgi:hypothetical protein